MASNAAFVEHATLAQLEQVEKAIDRATEEVKWCVELPVDMCTLERPC